jgi:hypothetical protein
MSTYILKGNLSFQSCWSKVHPNKDSFDICIEKMDDKINFTLFQKGITGIHYPIKEI